MSRRDSVTPKDEYVSLFERLKRFFLLVIFSFNPKSYLRFSQKRMREGFSYYFGVLILTIFVLFIVTLFKIPAFVSSIGHEFDKFDELNLHINMSLKDDITFANGDIRISEEGNYTDEKLFITKEKIVRKSLGCLFFKPICVLGPKKVTLDETNDYSNLTSHRDEFMRLFLFFAIISLPMLIVLYTLLIALKVLIGILLFSFVLIWIAHLTKRKLSYRQAFLISLYASTILLLAEPFNLLVISLSYVHFLVFVILAIVGVLFASDHKRRF